MINVNGQLIPEEFSYNNRSFKFGDALFETIKAVNSKILFWEDHYLRLMAAMRIIRMEIPMNFTMEFLETEVLKTIAGNQLSKSPARIRLTVYRNGEGYYFPESNTISYVIEAGEIKETGYSINKRNYTVDLFRDHYVNPGLLSTLKTNNSILNVVGSIYANENNYDNCLLLNQEKNVAEALNGNVFMVIKDTIKTPPLKDGCINGVLRKQIIKIVSESPDYTLEETSVSPFELQKADELFITNVIMGIQPVTRYRKKEYNVRAAEELNKALNDIIRQNI